MEIIPVIDLKGGVAVAAVRGDRARYRPLETPLARNADPVAVALGLRTLFPFDRLYVADLDGIEGRGADRAAQRRLVESWLGREIWIDDGAAGTEHANAGFPHVMRRSLASGEIGWGPVAQAALDGVPPPLRGRIGGGDSQPPPCAVSRVLGSESFNSLEGYERARERAGPGAPLSLDFRGDDFVGPRELLDDASLWPERVIVMTLARVGSGEGPDLARLASIVGRAKGRSVYAAGGVRTASDLDALRDIGVAGALVATSLHTGALKAIDLEKLAADAG